MRVVIAEDAVLLREGLVRLLAEEGHEVTAAVSSIFAKLGLQPTEQDHRRVLAVLTYLEGR